METKTLNKLCDEIYYILVKHKCKEVVFDEIGKLFDNLKEKHQEVIYGNIKK